MAFFNNTALDKEYARRLMSYLNKAKESKGSRFNISAVCHMPGCASNDRERKLGIFETQDHKILIHCFKCNFVSNVGKYLQHYHPDMYKEYLFHELESRGIKSAKPANRELEKKELFDGKVTKFNINDQLINYTSLDNLPKNHPIFRYTDSRCIPESEYSRIGYTSNWKELSNEIAPGTFTKIYNDHPRLVLPAFTKVGVLKNVNGRAFSDKEIRYQIIKYNRDETNIFGEEQINLNKDHIFFIEGPVDSLFIDNSVAINGAMIELSQLKYKKGKRVFVLDNEPFHVDTTRRLQKFIDAGELVVLWDNLPKKYKNYKDINLMIQKGWDSTAILKYMKENIASGLNAQLRFNNWKRLK